MKSVNARDALAGMARFGGAQAYVSTEDGKTVVELRKRSNEATLLRLRSSTFHRFEVYKDLPDKALEISITKGTALDIIKQIAQKTGLEYEIEDGLKSTRNNLSITMKDVSVGGALDMAAQWLECGWKAEKKGETVKIYFSKKYPKPAGNMIFMPSMPPPASLPRSPSVGTTFPGLATMPFRSTLPNKKVSLDKVKTDPREALKEVLKQAGLSYAIGDDLPSDPKSFTFSDVSITTALDMICESIGASWSTERGPDGKSVVRIGKAHSRSR